MKIFYKKWIFYYKLILYYINILKKKNCGLYDCIYLTFIILYL